MYVHVCPSPIAFFVHHRPGGIQCQESGLRAFRNGPSRHWMAPSRWWNNRAGRPPLKLVLRGKGDLDVNGTTSIFLRAIRESGAYF